MGHLQFLNQDGEWETFPTVEQQENLRANAEILEELGYKLICQLCNQFLLERHNLIYVTEQEAPRLSHREGGRILSPHLVGER
jgi:hypothetical protein